MGIDLNYQALPIDSEAFCKARVSREYWEDFTLMIPAWESKKKEPYISYCKENMETVKLFEEFPDIYNFTFSLDRVFEALNFIFNPSSFSSAVNLQDSFEYKLIYGEKSMPEHATGTQGILSRFSSPEFVKDSAEYLAQIDLRDLELRFDPVKMAELNLYKCGENEQFVRFKSYITDFAEFYSRVAQRNYGLICIRD
ncbi:MAG: YfbM family protein [Pseudomonadales bacterium]|nr:YfbM family protein [Pseudomonadales bacterium]